MAGIPLRHDYDAIIERLKSDLRDDAEIFEYAPISLWLEDFSGIRALFEDWRQAGVTDLSAHLHASPELVKECAERIRVVKVNRETLRLFGARNQAELQGSLDRVFRDDMLGTHVQELCQLWEGRTEIESRAVNYTLSGKRLDVELKGILLPGYEDGWERVLLVAQDVTERESARRRHATSEQYARGLFEHSPVSLWVEDFSSIKRLLDDVRERGITDFRVFTDVHPEFVERCMSEIRVLDVNRQTLEMFAAPSKEALLLRLNEVFRDDMRQSFREQLVDLWDGRLFQLREVTNYTLDGNELHVVLQLSVLPGREHDWSLVQVALTDITARKKAEAYLEFLGKHDVLTRLYNRSYYVDELNRLERKGTHPLTILIADLNELKATNDRLGHGAGDAMLRRVGEVLLKAAEPPYSAARIGGDEFALIMPGAGEHEAEEMMDTLKQLIELNNQFYSAVHISLSIGAATATAPGERLETVAKRADDLMYIQKRAFHAGLKRRHDDAGEEKPEGSGATLGG